jgi:hypothetical protein
VVRALQQVGGVRVVLARADVAGCERDRRLRAGEHRVDDEHVRADGRDARDAVDGVAVERDRDTDLIADHRHRVDRIRQHGRLRDGRCSEKGMASDGDLLRGFVARTQVLPYDCEV